MWWSHLPYSRCAKAGLRVSVYPCVDGNKGKMQLPVRESNLQVTPVPPATADLAAGAPDPGIRTLTRPSVLRTGKPQ